MATHPRDNEDDWVRDWSGTEHFFTAIRYKIEQNKLAIKASHEQSRARQTMRQQRGREYQEYLQEMIMTDPRRAAAPRLVPTTATHPRQHTDALHIADMQTVLVPVVRVPERTATTDEIPTMPKRTSQLTQFYQDVQERWCYIDTCQQSVHDLISKAIDAYVRELDTVPAQTLRIASTNMLYLIIDHKLKEDIYQDERGSFTLTSDPHVDVDTVVFG